MYKKIQRLSIANSMASQFSNSIQNNFSLVSSLLLYKCIKLNAIFTYFNFNKGSQVDTNSEMFKL